MMNEFDRFRDAVLTDESLQKRLYDIDDRHQFIASVIELGSELGYDLTATDVEDELRSDRRVWNENRPTPSPDDLRSWLPISIYHQREMGVVDWCKLDGLRFTHPFFDDTIRHALRRPFNRLFRHQTGLDVLTEVARVTPGLQPTGFILHMSRCGSTLASQMLAASSRNIVISEAPPIDSLLSSYFEHTNVSEEQFVQRFRDLVSVLGRPRSGESQYFIKFDSWATIDFGIILRAFPDVPWIFLYREPVEVIVSHMRQRGSQMIPGAVGSRLLPGLTLEECLQMAPEEYCALVLARVCEEALAHAGDRKSMFVNYRDLPQAMTGAIASHFRLDLDKDEISRMTEAASYNAKTPALFFEPDADAKRSEASPEANGAATRILSSLYERMERLRANFVA